MNPTITATNHLASNGMKLLYRLYHFSVRHFALSTLSFLFLFFGISISLIYQVIVQLPTISTTHPYSDALIYTKMTLGELSYWGPTHITHRVVFSSILAFLMKWIPIGSDYVAVIFHVGLLCVTLVAVYRLKDGIAFSFFVFLLLSLPAFYRGFFLPMPDTLLWSLLTLIWLLAQQKQTLVNSALITMLSVIAIFTKELAVLTLLFVFWDDYIRKKTIVLGLSFGIVLYVIVGNYYSISPNYIFQPKLWIHDWASSLIHYGWLLPKFLLSGFSLIFGVIFMRILSKSNKISYFFPEILLFLILFLFTPTNSPRLLFPFTGIITLRLMLPNFTNLQ